MILFSWGAENKKEEAFPEITDVRGGGFLIGLRWGGDPFLSAEASSSAKSLLSSGRVQELDCSMCWGVYPVSRAISTSRLPSGTKSSRTRHKLRVQIRAATPRVGVDEDHGPAAGRTRGHRSPTCASGRCGHFHYGEKIRSTSIEFAMNTCLIRTSRACRGVFPAVSAAHAMDHGLVSTGRSIPAICMTVTRGAATRRCTRRAGTPGPR